MSISGLADGKPRLKHAAAFVKKKPRNKPALSVLAQGEELTQRPSLGSGRTVVVMTPRPRIREGDY